MVALERDYITQEAYLALERAGFEESEYFGGQLYPMAGATVEHNRVKSNLSGEIGYFLKGKPCPSSSSDFWVHISQNSLYAYSDLIVVCDNLALLDNKFDTLLNPTILVEILSKSTRGYNKNAKFALCRGISTLREYLVVDSQRISVEVWHQSASEDW